MIIFRVDGNSKIGMGHLMRCFTIANQIENREEIVFYCADYESAKVIKDNGFCVQILETNYQNMEEELYEEGSLWNQIDQTWSSKQEKLKIVVDSYYVTKDYIRALSEIGTVFYLDDLCEERFPAQNIINYNIFAKIEEYKSLYEGKKKRNFYIGARYIPLREQFLTTPYEVKEVVKKIFITTGGGDKDNIALKLLNVIYTKNLEFHLVIGAFSPHLHEMKLLAKERENVFIYYNVDHMAKLMGSCDMAISAGGSTIYELCAIGIPFLCFSYARNQEKLVEFIGQEKIGISFGAYHIEPEKTLENLEKEYNLFLMDGALRKEMSDKERKIVDGLGARRIGAIITGVNIDE